MPSVLELQREYEEIIVPRMRRRRQSSAVGGKADTTAPLLSGPIGLPLADNLGYLAVVTNEANGTVYYVVTTSATPPSAAQVKAGQNDGGTAAAFAGNQAVIATGYQLATATGLTSNTAYYNYYMHEDAIGNQSLVSASTTYTTLTTGTSDTDFDNLIAAASVAPNNLRKAYIARFIGALYAGSVWTKIDVMWVLAAHDEQFGRLNWKSPSTFTLTAVNSPTFTTDQGFAGNASTSYLDTGWDWATNGVQYTQDNAHASAYQRTNGNAVGVLVTNSASYRTSVAGRQVGNLRLNSATNITGGTPTLPAQGIVRRNVSTDASVMFDGVQTGTVASTSTNTNGTADFFIDPATLFQSAQVAGASLGAYLDDTEALAFYNAWHDYMVALGADT